MTVTFFWEIKASTGNPLAFSNFERTVTHKVTADDAEEAIVLFREWWVQERMLRIEAMKKYGQEQSEIAARCPELLNIISVVQEGSSIRKD